MNLETSDRSAPFDWELWRPQNAFRPRGRIFKLPGDRWWHWRRRLRVEDLTKHIVVLGSIGSGKTSTVIAEIVRGCGRAGVPIVVFASKSSDADDFSLFLRQAGAPPAVVLSLSENGERPPFVFPFLRYLHDLGASSTEMASVLTETIRAAEGASASPSSSSKFWQDNMRRLLACSFEVLRVSPFRTDVANLSKFLQGISMLEVPETREHLFHQTVLHAARRRSSGDAAVLRALNYLTMEFPQMDSRTASSILATYTGLATDLEFPPLSTVLSDPVEGQKAVTPSTLLEEGRSIIIDIPTLSRPRPGKVFQALFHGAMQLAAHQRPNPEQTCVAFFDEAQESVSSASVLQTSLATARSRGLGYVLAFQSLTACRARFGQTQADAVVGLANATIACQNTDAATKRYLSDAAGNEFVDGARRRSSIAHAWRHPFEGDRGDDTEPKMRPRVLPEEVAGLIPPSKRQWRPRADAIVIRENRVHRLRVDRNPRSLRRWLGGWVDWVFDVRRYGVWGVIKRFTVATCLAGLVGWGAAPVLQEAYVAAPSVSELRAYVLHLWYGPVDSPPPAPVRVVVHRVRRGETLGEIAAVYRVPLPDLVRENRLERPDRIEVGQVIRIPGGVR